MIRNFIVLYLLIMFSCPGVSANINVSGKVARYTGSISDELNQLLFDQVAGQEVTRLVITSDGGDVTAGIALGYWVFNNGIDIEVPEYCLSSCANYVFTAGRNKLVRSGAIVAWHGNYNHLLQTGLWRDDIELRMQRTGEARAEATIHARALAEKLVAEERDFFTHIGVDEYLCWVGKMPPYNAADYYFLDLEDMARFGVNNVQIPADYRESRARALDVNAIYIDLN